MHEIERAADSRLIVLRPDNAPPVAYSDLDYAITDATAEGLINAVPDNTRRAYEYAWEQFARWCAGYERVILPATAQTLTEYVNTMIAVELAPATIDQAIGAIRAQHREAGYKEQPDTVGALKLLRAYRRAWADSGNRVRKRIPVLVPALRALVDTCDTDTLIGIRDRAMLLLAFNIMARRSEVCGLDIPDLRPAGEEGIEVFVRRSKTDQAAVGQSVPVPYGQHAATCAVRTARLWTDALAERRIISGALFRPVDRHGRVGGEPMAAGKPGCRLTGYNFNKMVQARAMLAGLPHAESYGAHGLRSGAATSAYAAGVPVSVIARQGRWSEKSPVVLQYIRAVDQWRDNPMKGLGL